MYNKHQDILYHVIDYQRVYKSCKVVLIILSVHPDHKTHPNKFVVG